ncbi:pre-rRNA processing and 40S ribosomal subunit assembly [Sporothrix bragantina]|uniref:Pre-rRNA processing and 40S ribosomal subunit assembly n=1 Tax=Sporothrix bragantina TaxID=671064 RepID=A0ABP0BG66_9PEZI
MATVLGKRKKAAADIASDSDAIQDIFRRHFEAQFKPLAVETKKTKKADKKGKGKESAKGTDSTGKKAQKGAPVVIRENESDDDGEDEDDEGFDEDDDSDESDGSEDWSGLSGDEVEDEPTNAAPAIEVVDYSTDPTKETPETAMSKHERKLYLSKRPPTSFDEEANRSAQNNKKSKKKNGEAAADGTFKDAPELLANDLELQRLISESHLLAGAFRLPSSFSTASGATSTVGSASDVNGTSSHKSSQPFAAGRLRQRTTDLRIQAVANKARGDASSTGTVTVNQASESIFTQAKMPMSMRKGIAAAAASRESKRRQEARESGIVLERPAVKPMSKSAAKRMRAVDAPAVGRMHGSELRLRDKDIRAIEGPRKGTFNKKKKRR